MTRRQTSESGSVFTILMAGIAIAAALSAVLYSTISGPVSSMVRITNKTQAKAQMQSIASIIIMDAVNNMPNNGDCSGTGVGMVVPRSWKPGTGPTGGGILPTTIGAPLTDPWGTNYGYCTWEVGVAGPLPSGSGCDLVNGYNQTCTGISGGNSCSGGTSPNVNTGYNALRLLGSINPTVGSASSQVVFAIISAGPNRTFNSTCSAYVNTSSTLVTPGGDDIVVSYTYQQAATATSSLWTLSPSSAATAVISKDISVGTTLGTVPAAVSSTYSNGIINGAAVVAQGEITSTAGAIGLANVLGSSTQLSSGNCNAGSLGQMYYNTSTNLVDVCTCAGGSCPATGTYSWAPLVTGSGSALNNITAATATNTIDSTTFGSQVWNWSGLVTGTALTLADTDASATTATTLAVNSTATTGTAGYFTNTGGGYALITGSGNVGIGTTAPLSALQVKGPASVTSFTGTSSLGLAVEGGTSNTALTGIDFRSDDGGSVVNPIARIASYTTGSGSYLQMGTSSNYSTGVTNTAITIDYNGNVGIGAAAPAYPFQIGNSLLSTSDISTFTPQQVEVNNLYTGTANASTTAMMILAQANAASNSSSKDYGLIVDNLVPSGQTVNYLGKIGIFAKTNNLGSGTAGNMFGAQLYGFYGGTNTATGTYGSQMLSENTSTGTVTNAYGAFHEVANTSTGTIGTGYGAYNYAANLSSGTMTTAYGSYNTVTNATGTITNAYGIYSTVPTNGGTITNAVGLLISTVTGTTAYGIYDQSGDPDYFKGEVGIGVNPTQSNGAMLQVIDSTLGTGLYVQESKTTGTNYGINATASNASTLNVGGYFDAEGATSNYAIEIPNLGPPAGANNYAIYSVSNAQSYIQGSLGVSTLPQTGARGLSVGFAAGAPSTTAANAGLVLFGSTTEALLVGADPSGAEEMWLQVGVPGNVVGPLSLNPVGGNVGIGTAAPGAPLEVRTTSAGYASNAGGLALTTAGSTNGLRFGVLDSSYSWISSFNSLPLVLNAGGNNVGIGTTSPTNNLSIYSNTAAATLGVNGDGFGAAIRSSNYWNAAQGPFLEMQKSRGSFATPAAILSGDSLGTLAYEGYDSAAFNTGAKIVGIAEENYSASAHGSAITFSTVADTTTTLAEKMRITGAGNVGIGTASPATNGLTINNGSTPTMTLMVNGTSNEQIYDDGTALYVMSVSGGNGSKLTHGATLWTSSSDRRLKKDIQPLSDAYGLDAVLRMKPVTFHWRNPKAPQAQQIGFVAQDMQQAIPEVVTRTAPTAYAPDGELGIEYAALVVPLVKSVQELKAGNDNLKAEDRKQFAALKAANDNEAAQIKALTARLDVLEAARH
jgi:endosialidase-like protein